MRKKYIAIIAAGSLAAVSCIGSIAQEIETGIQPSSVEETSATDVTREDLPSAEVNVDVVERNAEDHPEPVDETVVYMEDAAVLPEPDSDDVFVDGIEASDYFPDGDDAETIDLMENGSLSSDPSMDGFMVEEVIQKLPEDMEGITNEKEEERPQVGLYRFPSREDLRNAQQHLKELAGESFPDWDNESSETIFDGRDFSGLFERKDKTVITVSASESEKIKPDMASIAFTVYGNSETLEKAMDEAIAKAQSLLENICKILPEENVYTDSIDSYPEYHENEQETYRAVISITAEDIEINLLPSVMKSGLKAGAGQVSSPVYYSSTQEEIYSSILKKAIEKAKEKADFLAGDYYEFVRIVSIEEDSSPVFYASGKGYSEESFSSINPDFLSKDIEISASVSVSCEYGSISH